MEFLRTPEMWTRARELRALIERQTGVTTSKLFYTRVPTAINKGEGIEKHKGLLYVVRLSLRISIPCQE